jgi:hypothetical protein
MECLLADRWVKSSVPPSETAALVAAKVQIAPAIQKLLSGYIIIGRMPIFLKTHFAEGIHFLFRIIYIHQHGLMKIVYLIRLVCET